MRAAVVTLLLLVAACASAGSRDASVLHQFRKAHPCPATGKIKGACPGWQIDHIVPLCAGGADAVGNLQWLTRAAHAAKTREDVRGCKRNSRGELR